VNHIHPDLYPFQKEGALWLCEQQNAILADEMGLGKTPEAIAGADLIGAKRVLTICPGIARANWEREWHKWQMIPRSTCLIKSHKDRPTADVVISSYTALQSRPVLEALLSVEWDLIVADEGHLLKNKDALTTQICYGGAIDGRKGLASKTKRFWLLSGTPIPNGPHEMWTHARALFPKAVEGYEGYNSWVDRFCYWKEDRGVQKVMSAINVPDFVERMRPYIKRRVVADVLPDLPPLRFGHIIVAPAQVPPMPDQAAEADAIIRSAMASRKDRSKEISEEDMLALSTTQQMHIASLLRWTGVAKAPAVADAIRTEMENGLKKVVIFARHTEVFEILEKRIPGFVSITGKTPERKRQGIIDAFQGRVADNNPPALGCHIDIASTALTLTAADNVVFAETGWVPKDILQAAKRCHRIGQDRPVLARIFSLKDSLDEAVSDTIVRKYKSVSRIETQFTG
jgi:SNF2 family DNA or RNA helicase